MKLFHEWFTSAWKENDRIELLIRLRNIDSAYLLEFYRIFLYHNSINCYAEFEQRLKSLEPASQELATRLDINEKVFEYKISLKSEITNTPTTLTQQFADSSFSSFSSISSSSSNSNFSASNIKATVPNSHQVDITSDLLTDVGHKCHKNVDSMETNNKNDSHSNNNSQETNADNNNNTTLTSQQLQNANMEIEEILQQKTNDNDSEKEQEDEKPIVQEVVDDHNEVNNININININKSSSSLLLKKNNDTIEVIDIVDLEDNDNTNIDIDINNDENVIIEEQEDPEQGKKQENIKLTIDNKNIIEDFYDDDDNVIISTNNNNN